MKYQTFAERVSDKTKVPLAQQFINDIRGIAIDNNITATKVWIKWIDYTDSCKNFDQSPLLNEFKSWNKFN